MNELEYLREIDPARADNALACALAAAWMAFCKGLAVMGNRDAGEHRDVFQSWWLSYGIVDARSTLASAGERVNVHVKDDYPHQTFCPDHAARR